MVTTSGQQNIRGIDIDKLAKGFAEEDIVLKNYCTKTTTSAREIRWYQKTAGFITATTPAKISPMSQNALPSVLEQSWTRQTSYVKKFFIESPLLSDEDIKDTDIDVLATNIHDLTRSIAHDVDTRIYNVITESQSPSLTNTGTAAAAWNTASYTNVDMIADFMKMKTGIRNFSYNAEGTITVMTPGQHQNLVTWLISTKGSSIPIFSSNRVGDGVVMEFLGSQIVVNLVAVSGSIVMFVPQRSATWKSFVPITAAQVPNIGIGTKIRIWEEGECLLTDPKSVYQLTGVGI